MSSKLKNLRTLKTTMQLSLIALVLKSDKLYNVSEKLELNY